MSSRSRSRNSRGRGTKNSVPPINDPPKPLTFYVEVFEDWLGYEEDVYMRERKTLNERQLNYWKELTELVKNQIIVTNNDLGKIISFVARTTKKVFYLTGLRVSASEWVAKTDISLVKVNQMSDCSILNLSGEMRTVYCLALVLRPSTVLMSPCKLSATASKKVS